LAIAFNRNDIVLGLRACTGYENGCPSATANPSHPILASLVPLPPFPPDASL
jgi:hypothetical protein